jgi:cell pole-organizing protein PopZ
MEEILASIRQIISEDSEASSAPKAEDAASEIPTPPAAEAEAGQVPYETVVSRLETTPAPEPAPLIEPRPAYQEIAKAAPARAPEPAADYGARQPRPTPLARRPAPQEDAPLLSPEKGAAISGAFGSLAHTLLEQNSRTLEDVVAEMLQPMLKAWLEDNLPSLVERMVQEEIERVSRGRR